MSGQAYMRGCVAPGRHPVGGMPEAGLTRREVSGMFRLITRISRLGKSMILIAATAAPAAAWAQWWGPYGAPVGMVPGPATPPAPPSVGAFMSNPAHSAAGTQRGVTQPLSSGKQNAASPGYYVIRPSMFGPPVYVLHRTPMAAGSYSVPPNSARPPRPAEQAEKTPEEPRETGADKRRHDTASATTTIAARETDQGGVLVDAEGMTLYVSGSDQVGESSCYADCARNWPPAAAPINAESQAGLGVIAREDGTRQWAYKGRPLYRWAGDKQPGDVTGDGLGGAWAVARTD